jgi:hypothetical protein
MICITKNHGIENGEQRGDGETLPMALEKERVELGNASSKEPGFYKKNRNFFYNIRFHTVH